MEADRRPEGETAGGGRGRPHQAEPGHGSRSPDTVPGPPDAAAVARCLAGEPAAFEVIVRRYAARLHRLAESFLADREEAADVVQEVLLSAYERLGTYDPDRPMWPWLARAAVNRAIDRLRSARGRGGGGRRDARGGANPTPLENRPGRDAPPDEALIAEEERRRVHSVLQTLPERYRTVLVLREMEGMSAEEIARVIRRPAATVRWRIFKARRIFRDAWLAEERKE